MPSTTNTAQPLRNPVSAILLTGFTAGLLDITAACTQYYIKTGKGPGNVLRYVASAVFGKKAFTGGLPMAGWGLLFHFIIAFGLTLFFFWIYPRVSWIGKNKIVAGIVYGIFAWLVTTQLIVPLSQIGRQPIVFSKAIVAVLILVCCIGLPISLMTNKHYLYKK
ncbi:MAG: hypothetical protein ABIT05_15820 [Chitinophagaceae bacterium]